MNAGIGVNARINDSALVGDKSLPVKNDTTNNSGEISSLSDISFLACCGSSQLHFRASSSPSLSNNCLATLTLCRSWTSAEKSSLETTSSHHARSNSFLWKVVHLLPVRSCRASGSERLDRAFGLSILTYDDTILIKYCCTLIRVLMLCCLRNSCSSLSERASSTGSLKCNPSA